MDASRIRLFRRQFLPADHALAHTQRLRCFHVFACGLLSGGIQTCSLYIQAMGADWDPLLSGKSIISTYLALTYPISEIIMVLKSEAIRSGRCRAAGMKLKTYWNLCLVKICRFGCIPIYSFNIAPWLCCHLDITIAFCPFIQLLTAMFELGLFGAGK